MAVYDAIVIGGGLAGTAAAIGLAQAKQKVLLIEKEAQAHHKVCGEFISIEAQNYLTQLGIELPSLGARRIDQVRLIQYDKTVTHPLPFHAYSLSRYRLDEALLQRATQCGVEIWRGQSANRLWQENAHWQVEVAPQNKPLAAKAVFLATGKHDLRGWPRPAGLQNDLIGFKMYFQKAVPDTVAQTDIVLFAGGYAGIENVEDGLINLCLVVTKARFAALNKSWPHLLAELFKVPALAARLKDATPCWLKPLAIFGIPYGMVHQSSADNLPNLYRLGDQMAVIPSFVGNGMSIALHTATTAVNCFLQHDIETYQQKMLADLSLKIRVATRLSQMLVQPFGQNILFNLCRLAPALLNFTAKTTRLKIKA